MIILVRGLIGSGKTTFAKSLNKHLISRKINFLHLDGDEIRKIWNQDLKYDNLSRSLSAKRAIKLLKLLNKKKINILVSALFVDYSELEILLNKVKFISVFISTDLNYLRKKNKKNIYSKNTDVPGINNKYGVINKKCIKIRNDHKKNIDILVKKFLNDHNHYIVDNSY